MKYLTLFSLLASPIFAETPMTSTEFAAFTGGRTFTYVTPDGTVAGSEQYLSGQRYIWSYGEGECDHGVWYESKGSICFRHAIDTETVCWIFHRDGDGMRASFPESIDLYAINPRAAPVNCAHNPEK